MGRYSDAITVADHPLLQDAAVEGDHRSEWDFITTPFGGRWCLR